MEIFDQIIAFLTPIFKNIWVQIILLIAFATAHGYAGAWLAVRMLFRPRMPVKVLGLTVFPQGMIPRNRARLARAIGKAVGDELVSQDTILEQLTGKDFLRKRIQAVVDSFTDELLSHDHPSLIEALPGNVRGPVLDAVSSLQHKLAKHVDASLKSIETQKAVCDFVTRRVDEVLGNRVSTVLDNEASEQLVDFLSDRVRSSLNSKTFEDRIRDFVGQRVDDVAGTETPLGELFTNDAIALLKEKANEQIEPAIHQLTELAAAERTRSQIGALIKKEVHGYYENLPFYKKFFVSRENLLNEVDDLVNESLPKRIEETLRGEFFAAEARAFIGSSIDNALLKPLPAVLGKIAPEQLSSLKTQIASSALSLIRGKDMIGGISAYISETLYKLRPHSIDSILRAIHPESEKKLKSMLTRGLLDILAKEETSNIINEILAGQVERLLSAPIGRLADLIPEEKIRDASVSLTEAIVAAVHAKLPEAIAEFDVGSVVREKIENYPAEKLESLVMSVAREHLRTIELFGALFGFIIGTLQAVQFYFYAK